MRVDPRNPEADDVMRTTSLHPAHADIRKILVLLKIESIGGPVYFVVEGMHLWPLKDGQTLTQAIKYYYEEHICPTNFIDVPLIAFDGDFDPHGVFEVVDAVWMTYEFVITYKEHYLAEVFPQLANTGETK